MNLLDFDLVIAIQIPKLPTTPEMFDDIPDELQSHDINIINVSSLNYKVLDRIYAMHQRGQGGMLPNMKHRYVNIHFDVDAIDLNRPYYKIYKCIENEDLDFKKVDRLTQIKNEINQELKQTRTLDDLIHLFIEKFQGHSILILDLVKNKLSSQSEQLFEQIQERFENASFRNVSFFGGKRKTKRKSKRKSYKK